MTQTPLVRGAHLVGSINQPTAADTFRIVSENLGAHLTRLPDGEVGERFHWILFQGAAFDATPGLTRLPIDPIVVAGFDLRPLHLDGSVPADALEIAPLGYASAAIDSYAQFVALRDAGTIPAGVRFQVCLPSPLAPLTAFVLTADRAAVYPAYERAILRELAAITAAIPAADLAIQIDLATEFAYIEGVSLGGGPLVAWFADSDSDSAAHTAAVIDGCVELAARIASAVPAEVELGFHLCYGDVAESHFVEPPDSAHLVAVANGLRAAVSRPIDFVHLPVPIERDDAAYFAPLAELTLGTQTELFLGLVHHEDGIEGAERRIRAAAAPLTAAGINQFGVATECGFGRGPAERTAPLLALHAAVIEAS
ncbi:hypothetical protein AB4Y63_09660 [Leifsonia sp. YAF41]|uniref:hypothetical protein n=1 Tax=Leifsonia sp. YAF41 TaxID=3233086 RepID=UPI003F99D8A1